MVPITERTRSLLLKAQVSHETEEERKERLMKNFFIKLIERAS